MAAAPHPAKKALYVVEGWSPITVGAALSDNEVFELMTAAVFEARFNPTIVKNRWPCIRKAYAAFDLVRVANWPDEQLTHLLNAHGMIRNPKKIRASLANAKVLLTLSEDHGNLQAYLHSFGQDREALVRDIDTWARYIGAPSIRWMVQTLEPALPSVRR